MYILTRKRFPIGHQANCAAHAAVKCVELNRVHPDMTEWLDSSFRKVTCWVTDDQFEQARNSKLAYVTMREDALDDKTIAMAFVPRQEWPSLFKTFLLFGQRLWLVRLMQLLNLHKSAENRSSAVDVQKTDKALSDFRKPENK